jgi:hypothetical protein
MNTYSVNFNIVDILSVILHVDVGGLYVLILYLINIHLLVVSSHSFITN